MVKVILCLTAGPRGLENVDEVPPIPNLESRRTTRRIPDTFRSRVRGTAPRRDPCNPLGHRRRSESCGEKATCALSRDTRTGLPRRMPPPGMLRHGALGRTDVSEERSASIIRVTRIGELGTLATTSNRRTLRRNGLLWPLVGPIPDLLP
jgi:hypothetical protein